MPSNLKIKKIKACLLTICVIGVFFCCIPAILNWKFYLGSYNIDDAPITKAITSTAYGYTVVSTMSSSGLLLVEYLFDAILSKSFKRKGNVTRALLSLTQFLPDIALFSVIIPTHNLRLFSIIFNVRPIICITITFWHLCEFGAPIFNSSLSVVVCGMLSTASVLQCYLSFFPMGINYIFILYQIFIWCGCCCFTYISIKWFLHLHTQTSPLTTIQYSCNIYLMSLQFIGCSGVIVFLTFGWSINYDTAVYYFIPYNAAGVAYISFISLLQGRIVQNEMYKVQQILEMKRMFVRFSSHEIRTPLNTVFCGLKLLRQQLVNTEPLEDCIETIQDIEVSCDIALNVLNDLLSYEKLEAGILALERTMIKAGVLVRETVKPFIIQARQSGIDLHMAPTSHEMQYQIDHALIYVDKYKLSQVIRNLLSNALKFTPSGGSVVISLSLTGRQPTLEEDGDNEEKANGTAAAAAAVTATVGATNATTATSNRRNSRNHQFKNWLVITVTDTGYGIAPENVHKLFHEIIQFSPGQLQNGGGSGLGLWISRSIVELHEGEISAYSDGIGKGSVFTVRIPIAESNTIINVPNLAPRSVSGNSLRIRPVYNSGSNNNSARLSSENNNNNSGRIVTAFDFKTFAKFKVLLVDDSQLNRKMLSRTLKSKFQTVTEAVDGQDALTQVTTSLSPGEPSIDVILMDYVMPNMDGPTATKKIRKLGYNGIIIGATGNALPVDIQTFQSSGTNAVLTKPIDLNLLYKTIASLSSLSRSPVATIRITGDFHQLK